MNRELKFRAWDKKDKIMLYQIEEDDIINKKNVFLFEGFSFCDKYIYLYSWQGDGVCEQQMPIDIYDIMQYTGMKDRNGKEIYENDVIEGDLFDYRLPNYRLPTMGHVVFDNEHCFYANKNEAGLTALFKINNIKIIGNIYETPELLKDS